MEYDDIDIFVSQLDVEPDRGASAITVLPSDSTYIEYVDQVIQDARAEVIEWHNERISRHSCSKCGINHIGGCMSSSALDDQGGYSSVACNGTQQRTASVTHETQRGGLSCAEVVLTGVLFILGLAACGLLAMIFDWVQVYGV